MTIVPRVITTMPSCVAGAIVTRAPPAFQAPSSSTLAVRVAQRAVETEAFRVVSRDDAVSAEGSDQSLPIDQVGS